MKQANSILAALVVCMIRCGGVFAGDPQIVGLNPAKQPDPAPVRSNSFTIGVNKFYPLRIEGYDGPSTWMVDVGNGLPVGWRMMPKGSNIVGVLEGSEFPFDVKVLDHDSLVMFGLNPGKAKVRLLGIVDGLPKQIAEVEITVIGARPPPEDPKPDPIDPPKPAPGKIKEGYVVVLYDDKFMGVKAAKTLGNTQWKLDLGKLPGVLDFRPYDVTIADTAKKGYLAKGVEFLNDNKVYDWSRPVVMFLSKDAKVVDIQFFDLDNAKAQIQKVIAP